MTIIMAAKRERSDGRAKVMHAYVKKKKKKSYENLEYSDAVRLQST